MNSSITPINQAALRQLLKQLLDLRQGVLDEAQTRLSSCSQVKHSLGAINLVQYLSLRSHDLRTLQNQLSSLGLSSLGHGEAGIVDNLNRVINLLCWILGETFDQCVDKQQTITGEQGHERLKVNTQALLGSSPSERNVLIMVTLSSNAADDYELVRELIDNGMNCARINCAHDDEPTWLAMINHVRRASEETGSACRIMMDLAGQKIRTGKIDAGPAVFHLKSKHDEYGKVIEPGYIHLVNANHFEATRSGDYFQIAIDEDAHADLDIEDCLNFVDQRGKRRHLEIVCRDEDGRLLARCWQGAYLSDQTKFQWRHKGKKKTPKDKVDVAILGFQKHPAKIRVYKGDPLLLTENERLGAPAHRDSLGLVDKPAHIGISHSEILSILRPGASVWIDDGKIGTEVESLTEEGVLLRVTNVRSKGALVREDKGVNLPDSKLALDPLTEKDLRDLDFICQHADIVAYSFVQSAEDMQCLHYELSKRGTEDFPIIAKIETHKAVENLPEIILSTLEKQPLGIMIARGDLAIELGSVRMAEIQEEILWLCEAAHVPVIWATQVLESLAKDGIRSRPEVTDAAMSVRAECVMLNKGPYIIDALTVLNDILLRMQAHQRKKGAKMRALQQWAFDVPIPTKAINSP